MQWRKSNLSSGSSTALTDSGRLDSFITSTGLPLLDISLYVSYENYRLRTRSSFTQILPWYANFILPPRLRSAARARTAHLGISSIDIDTVHESVIDKPPSLQQQPRQFEEHETEKHAKRLLGQRNPLGSMLRASEHAAAFKVKALADAFFEPLEDALSSKLNLLGTNNISAIDCLAFGYLSLMLYPRMPQAWLELSLKNQYPKLKAYTDRLRTRFDMDTTVADAFQKEQDSVGNEDSLRPNNHVVAGKLPWTQPQRLSLSGAVTYVGRAVHRQLPFPNSGAQVKTQPVKDHEIGWLGNTILYLPALAAMAFTGYWFYLDRPWPRGEAVHHFGRRSRLGEFGAAGALLGGLDLQMYSPTAEAGSRGLEEYRDGKVTVEVVEDDEAI